MLGCDSATLVTLCVYVVAYLVLFLMDGIQRPEEVGGLCACAKGQDVLVIKDKLQYCYDLVSIYKMPESLDEMRKETRSSKRN